jgi:hypothetical protein
LSNETPLDIILVSRDIPDLEYIPIELDEIALIFACLAANIHQENIPEIKEKLSTKINTLLYTEATKNITGYLRTPELKDTRIRAILEKFDEYCGSLNPIIPYRNTWKLIVFNEMFFPKKSL